MECTAHTVLLACIIVHQPQIIKLFHPPPFAWAVVIQVRGLQMFTINHSHGNAALAKIQRLMYDNVLSPSIFSHTTVVGVLDTGYHFSSNSSIM